MKTSQPLALIDSKLTLHTGSQARNPTPWTTTEDKGGGRENSAPKEKLVSWHFLNQLFAYLFLSGTGLRSFV